jgi:hypothetical protein
MEDRSRLVARGLFVAIMIGVVSAAGCGEDGSIDDVNGIGMMLSVAPGITINTVSWEMHDAASTYVRSGSVHTRFSNTLRFRVDGPPPGAGYTITLTATSVDGAITCTGSAMFVVTAGVPVSVNVTLSCFGGVADAGTVIVNGTTALCAHINGISVSPLVTTVGNPISLVASVSTLPVAPTLEWTATAGTFDDPHSATPTFTCPATPGPVTLTLSVSPGSAACPTTRSQSVEVECETLAPTFTNVYANVISARCISCHRAGGPGGTVGTLDMSTQALAYASLVGVPATGTGAGTSGTTCVSLDPHAVRIRPGDPVGSLLYEKVVAKQQGTLPACGSPMPPSASSAPLTPAQTALIAAWISGGALND